MKKKLLKVAQTIGRYLDAVGMLFFIFIAAVVAINGLRDLWRDAHRQTTTGDDWRWCFFYAALWAVVKLAKWVPRLLHRMFPPGEKAKMEKTASLN